MRIGTLNAVQMVIVQIQKTAVFSAVHLLGLIFKRFYCFCIFSRLTNDRLCIIQTVKRPCFCSTRALFFVIVIMVIELAIGILQNCNILNISRLHHHR